MFKKFGFITILAIFIVCILQFSIMALNNVEERERDFAFGRYSGTSRNARDSDPPLSSWAYTGVYARAANPNLMQDLLYNWSASGGASYNGDNPRFKGSYDVKATILGYERHDAGNYVGTLSASEGFYIQMSPPADNAILDIGDCSSHGEADGHDPTLNKNYDTRSEIPFP